MKILIFLGNPGKDYVNTRHNAGFMIGDKLANLLGGAASPGVAWEKKNQFLRWRSDQVWLIKPQTFMNLSGEVLRYLPNFQRADLLIVVDDLALPLGKLRFRQSGSAGGHNGLKSIAATLGDNNYARLRFGVGDGDSPRGDELVGKVLGDFTPAEREKLPPLYELAANACADWITRGDKFCQDKYNGEKLPSP